MDDSEKFLALQSSLIKVGLDQGYANKSYDAKLKEFVQLCAAQLDADRVSIWSCSEDQNALLCQLQFDATTGQFENGKILKAADYPDYFNAMRAERAIIADDARNHPATAAFRTNYLEPLGIYSMLDVPIVGSENLCGVLCIEYRKQVPGWDLAEMSYAVAVADRISLVNQYESWLSEREKKEFIGRVDMRTGLENRAFFHQRVRRDLASFGADYASAMIIAELENFKTIGIKWGLEPTIAMLSELADRLVKRPELRECYLGRTSSDCYAVWIPSLSRAAPLEEIIAVVQRELSMPITSHGQGNIRFTTNIGISTQPVADLDIRDPLRLSEIALSKAQSMGSNQIAYFSTDWYQEYSRRNALEEELVKGINDNCIIPYYQPIIDAASGAIVGAEALMRWQHPTQGILTPEEFFPVARESGWMTTLTDIMLLSACEDLQRCRLLPEHQDIWFAVNLAYEDLYSTRLASSIATLLDEYKLPGSALVLEITEELVNHDVDMLKEQLRILDQLGIRLAIDDFGKGYSSLSRLKGIPVTKLKIDRSFTDGLPGDENDVCITESILGLAKGLKLATVAEGVENREQLLWLQARGCNYVQGFYLAHPMPFAEFSALLRNQSAA